MAGLSSLALLDLSRNQLGTISREALQPLSSLQVLRLTGNFLWPRVSSCTSRKKQAQVHRGSLLSDVVGTETTPHCGHIDLGSSLSFFTDPDSGGARFFTSLQKRISE